jgi:hypothetical protein
MHDELVKDKKHAVVTRVRDPSGEVVSETGGEVEIVAEAAREEWLTGVILPAMIQFEAGQEGTYMIEFDVDDASAALPIHVAHGLPPGVDPPPG